MEEARQFPYRLKSVRVSLPTRMKKCIICGKEAEFGIKDSNEYYCKGCAAEHFNDLSYLQKIEEEVNIIKELIEKQQK